MRVGRIRGDIVRFRRRVIPRSSPNFFHPMLRSTAPFSDRLTVQSELYLLKVFVRS